MRCCHPRTAHLEDELFLNSTVWLVPLSTNWHMIRNWKKPTTLSNCSQSHPPLCICVFTTGTHVLTLYWSHCTVQQDSAGRYQQVEKVLSICASNSPKICTVQ